MKPRLAIVAIMAFVAMAARGFAMSADGSLDKSMALDAMPTVSRVMVSDSDTVARFPLPADADRRTSPLFLGNPSNIKDTVEYDPESNDYMRVTRMGDIVLSRKFMTLEEYQNWQTQQMMNQYWRSKGQTMMGDASEENMLSRIPGFNEISRKLESLMGKPEISITPTGSADLTFQIVGNYREDPNIDENLRHNITFDFDENIQISLNAKIGDLVSFDVNWNTQATFDFENQIKLKYEGKEDDILQLFEAADISFPLNTTLIKGSQKLFGIHTKLKFGRITLDLVASEKETSTENMQVQGGASSEEFEIRADEYEENRHYFVSQYFYENYNHAMSTLPLVASNIKIIRMEVWRTNIGAAVTNNRDLLALTDLGERNPANRRLVGRGGSKPSNTANNLLEIINTSQVRDRGNITQYMQGAGFVSGTDYEKIESARLLTSSEYTYNSQLGFISLSQPLSNDQMLAVAFQYQVIGDTTVYQVGELTTDGVNDPNTLIVKLLKGASNNTHHPIWHLMMKNVYFLKSTQISPDNFRLNILYENPEGGVGVGYFTEGAREGEPLIGVFGFDRMDATKNYYHPDGVFDWFDSAAFKGGTIQATSGRIYFPYVEPFGKDLDSLLGGGELAKRYCFDSLYTMTQTLARQYADKNKFYLEGYYTSAVSGEISLGYSVTQGSVTVTAGGMPLIENVDYTVDYTMGTVRIINESILASGTPISVSSENNSFSMMTKRMLGAHINYEFSPDINLGATYMSLREKPLTQKNNFGEEPTTNRIMGLDFNYRHDAPFITKMVDLLPGIQTKAPSNLSLTAEFAYFKPGMANTGSQDGNVSYIDDFEGAESSIDLRGVNYWHLASTPQDYGTSLPRFPETAPNSGLAYGMNRARLAWYRIDNIFYTSNCPDNIDVDDRSRPYARRIYEQEVFPNKDLAAGDPTNIYEFNIAYYPSERGPYNYDAGNNAFAYGFNADGSLKRPEKRWGGIMRSLDYTDFETQNIETIEFWLMDPFMDPTTGEHKDDLPGGKLFINLGDISEDILRDGKKAFENGLPTSGNVVNVDTTIWGRVPTSQPIVNAFDNDEQSRKYQDIGYDGLGSTNGITDEQSFFEAFLRDVAAAYGTSSQAYTKLYEDPSSDNFTYFRSSRYDDDDVKITDRYKYYNNPEGNSSVDADNTESYSTSGSLYPNVEDINRDNTLSEAENYYQYEVQLDPRHMNIGENYIVDIQVADNVQLANGEVAPPTRWYQFRIPIREPDSKVGSISGFQSIRFMRMFLTEFEKPIILRFATLELVYGTWRKYSESLLQPGDYPTGNEASTSFTISTVNIEENGSREPVPYVLPPGIDREEWFSTTSSSTQLDEQSLSLDITNLGNGDARAVYRNTQYDLRYYDTLKMFVHAEEKVRNSLRDDELVLFVRLGSDYTSNYYEYEVPLKLTQWGVSKDSRRAIWPAENEVRIPLQELVALKTHRNDSIRLGKLNYSSQLLHHEMIGGHLCSVLGSPNLGKVKVIMIGVRNPKKESLSDGYDMMPKSVMVWVNELRLSQYNSKGGIAAMALARTNLADVGNLSFYVAGTGAGFGNLEDNLNKLEQVTNYNIQTTLNLELGKFLPDSWAMHIPFYIDYNKEIGVPKYNPLDPDVVQTLPMHKVLLHSTEYDSLIERKTTTNITLANVRKERVGKSALNPHFYDIENLSFTYAYSGERSSDEDVDHFNKDQHRGGFTYNYSISQPKQLRPFAKNKLLQSKPLRIIGDFNLYYQPRNLTFTTEIYRDFEETELRNKTAALIKPPEPTYFKQFTWRRDYGLQYDISRSLRLQFDASANCRIDEPIGRIDTESARDSIRASFKNGGTKQGYSQNLSLSWDVPIGKLPLLDFVRMPVTYRSTYNYTGATMALAEQGGLLENSGNFNATLTANFQTLYNKSKFLKKAYQPPKKKEVKAPTRGKDADVRQNRVDPKRQLHRADSLSLAKEDSIRKAKAHERTMQVVYFGARLVTCVKNVSAQYNYSTGARVAGFRGEPQLMGLDMNANLAPGWGFVFGAPSRTIMESLRADTLLSRDTLMNTPSNNTSNKVFSMQGTVEPLRDFKIELTCTQNYSSREEYYYKLLNELDEYVEGPLSYVMTGSYTTTAWTWRTALKNPDQLYADFRDARIIVAERLAEMNRNPYPDIPLPDSVDSNFPRGYSANSQTVLLTSFLATYLGKDPAKMGFSPFMDMPLPNWSINYTGLNKVEFLKKWFTNITLSHRYSSTYSVGNFYTDANLSGKNDGYDYGSENIINASGDYVPPVSMEGVQFSEQFNPLIKVSLNMVNSLQFNFSLQRNRNIGLSFANNQITETSRDGVTFGGGYRFKDVKVKIKTAEKTHNLKSDVVLQLNLTYNSNKTEIRRISQDSAQISSGSAVWMAEVSGEYAISSTLTLRAFAQTNINTPYISNSYKNRTTKAGITIRFSF